jgi:hypothetical protein
MWMSDAGLAGRPWFRNLYAATDRFSGYGTSSWPLLREAIEDATAGSQASDHAVAEAAMRYLSIAAALERGISEIARRPVVE